jgi:hypothetical protein
MLHAADTGLNPVAAGGGSNVKVPAYLAAGLAVVSTPFGMRGYGALESLVRVAPAETFAEAWRQRPQGWARASGVTPPALAAFAWGAIGERLGEALTFARPAAGATQRAESAGRAPEGLRDAHLRLLMGGGSG